MNFLGKKKTKTYLDLDIGKGTRMEAMETYGTIKRRLLDGRDFIEATNAEKRKFIINKNAVMMTGAI